MQGIFWNIKRNNKFQFIEKSSQRFTDYSLFCTFLLLSWGNDDTEQLIKILKEYDVPATFFVVGAWVDKYPESVKQLCDAGHRIENHSNTHPYMTQLSKTQMKNELTCCNEKIKKITGRCPTLFRPPYGDYDNAVIEATEECKMYPIQWDCELSATVGNPHEYWGCEMLFTLNFAFKHKP